MERDEIAKQLRKLERQTCWKTIRIVMFYVTLIILGDLLVSVMDVTLQINSPAFCIGGGFINAFLFFRAMGRDISAERDRVSKEVQKIFKK